MRKHDGTRDCHNSGDGNLVEHDHKSHDLPSQHNSKYDPTAKTKKRSGLKQIRFCIDLDNHTEAPYDSSDKLARSESSRKTAAGSLARVKWIAEFEQYETHSAGTLRREDITPEELCEEKDITLEQLDGNQKSTNN